MTENNEMAEILVLVVKRAGANMKQHKIIRHIGSMASVGRKEKWRQASQAFRNKNDDSKT